MHSLARRGDGAVLIKPPLINVALYCDFQIGLQARSSHFRSRESMWEESLR